MTPGPLVGSGPAADVFDVGGGRVLRRYRVVPTTSGLVEREAAVMRHLGAHGFPVPAQRLLNPNVRPAEAARIHALVAAQR